MEKVMKDILPIMDIEHDCIVSKQGDISIVFKAVLPEIFTLSSEDYEGFHQTWIKAIKILPKYSLLHKQDWFIKKPYQPNVASAQSFLAKSSEAYFEGRPYLDHECYLTITLRPKDRKPSTSLFSSLLRRSIVPAQLLDNQAMKDFTDVASQFRRILEASGFAKLSRLSYAALASDHQKVGYIERYCSLNETATVPMIKDIALKESISIGKQHCQLYTLSDVDDLPALCGSRITYDKYSTDRTKFPIGFAAAIGHLLPCNHIYNQYLIIDDAGLALKKLERKRLRLQSLSAYSRENAIARDATNDFLNEAICESRLPVKAHFNILAWSEEVEELKEIRNNVSSALAQMDAVAKMETVGAPQLFWAGIPGNAADLPQNECFDTFVEQASCFFTMESNYRSARPGDGIRFCDRNGKPVYVDLYDEPRRLGITSNMGTLVCGTSGGGKSVTVNHMLQTLHSQGAHCVIVDIGGSYRGLCSLLGGYYFTYEEKAPIKFNPFFLPEGQTLDTEKKESLKSLLVALWKQENEQFNRSEYVALSNALQQYYDLLKSDGSIFPCFNSFYDFLQEQYIDVLKAHRVKDKDFDIDNFLYVLRPFYQGGEFDYLLNAAENLDVLNQPFVVIELDNIKDHPILFPVITLIIMEMFISKMRKLQGKRKVLAIDEAWKAIAKNGMAEFVKYAYKTIRKFNGIPIVITQELEDVISSAIIKDAIINNTDIKILTDMRKFVNKFDKLQEVLGLSEKGKHILLSVNKDNREIFVDVGGQILKVYKNELCPEEYYAYTTEGKERVKVMEYAERYGSYELGIAALVKELKEEHEKQHQ